MYIHSFWKWSTLMNGDSGGKADDMLNVVLARIHITVVLIGYTIGGLAFLTVAVRLFRDDELFSGVVFLIVGIGLASVGICLTVKWGYNALINQPLVPPKDHFVRNAILDFNGGWLVLSGVLIWVLGATLVSLNDLRYWRPGD